MMGIIEKTSVRLIVFKNHCMAVPNGSISIKDLE